MMSQEGGKGSGGGRREVRARGAGWSEAEAKRQFDKQAGQTGEKAVHCECQYENTQKQQALKMTRHPGS